MLTLKQFHVKGSEFLLLDVTIMVQIHLSHHIFEVLFGDWMAALAHDPPHDPLELFHCKVAAVLTIVLPENLLDPLVDGLVGDLFSLSVVVF